MVLVTAVRDYVLRMLNEVQGLKVLVLDDETLGMVSLALSQSEILHRDVVLVEKVDSRSQELMTHLKAVVFVRPTPENISRLKKHLATPRFSQYHIFFSNIISTSPLHILADADDHDVVVQVQEFFADFFPLDAYHFTVSVRHNHFSFVSATADLPNTQRICDRSKEALLAVFLSLKKRPAIRYQKGSEMARRIAHEVGRVMYETEKGLFDFRRTDSTPLLLLIDRRDDPVTPLLNQWTYQAMVHELLGIKDNRVDLRTVAGISDDQKEVVLAAEQDEFFKRNMFENFGDVGVAISKAVDELQKKDKRRQGLNSLDDMAQLLDSYPEYRRQAGNVAKHVALMSELQKRVEARKLMAVSQEEQELACSPSHTQVAAYEAVMAQLNSPSVSVVDKMRLTMLYALRFEKESPRHFTVLVNKLSSCFASASPTSSTASPGGPPLKAALVHTLLRVFGASSPARVGDLYGNKDLLNVVARNVKRGLTGVENVYTQHQPLLMQTVDAAVKGRLSDADYPSFGAPQQFRAQDIVLFIVGGTTYEEARAVALFNATNPGMRLILGGTSLLNSSRFLEDIAELNTLESTSGLE